MMPDPHIQRCTRIRKPGEERHRAVRPAREIAIRATARRTRGA
jgi:hypothetical protein